MSIKSKNQKGKRKETKIVGRIILLSAFSFAILLGFWLAKRESADTNKDKIEISGVLVNDFLKGIPYPQRAFVTIVKNEDYHIFYVPEQKSFTISIISPAFDGTRIKAEEEFLRILGVDKKNACKLNVSITTPSFVNPGKAGEIYGLSFCR